MTDRPTIFISYSHADKEWKEKVLVQLKAVFGPDPPVEFWDDGTIRAGDAWNEEIEAAVARAHAAVLLITAEFLTSEFIQRNELPILLRRREQEGIHLLPLLVRACPWKYHHWLAELQMWPHGGRPIQDHPHADVELADFAAQLEFRLRPSPPRAPWEIHSNATVPLGVISAPQGSRLRPAYRDQHTRQKGEELAAAYEQRRRLSENRLDTTAIDTRILGLKRKLRQGPQLQPGEFLGKGRYQLIDDLDHGGFATVWLAYDQETKQQVALKVLHGQFSTSEERRERLFRGARQMAKLDHPNVVKVLGEPAVEDGWAYYVMEYLGGGDFRRAVLDARLDLEARLAALGEIAAALDYAHERSIIHRDVKPANILLTAQGEAKLSDFDLVRADDSTGLTRTRAGMGSYHYAAPECQENAADATRACDVYSFAATLAFALSGKELGSRFLFERSAFLSGLEIPEAARAMLARALHLEPAARQATAGTLYRELQAARRPKPKPASEPRPVRSKPTESEKPTRRSTAAPVARSPDLFRTVVTPLDGEVELWRKIPAGEGVIGSREGEGLDRERPQHRILVTCPFWMSAVPITNAQYAAFDSKKADLRKPDHSVVNVTWREATAFCAWLAEKHSFTGVRLPTEEEWEYACRAGSETAYWSGNKEADLERVGWYDKNSESRTHAVGEKPANAWGLYDVHGNVWEWTASVWDSEKYQKRSTKEPLRVDPAETPADLAAPPGDVRVMRGGGFWVDADGARSACRNSGLPASGFGGRGFRVLLLSAPSED